ncbi:MAG: hypothetical protein ACE5FU_13730 [Nitrospinota bacterium]
MRSLIFTVFLVFAFSFPVSGKPSLPLQIDAQHEVDPSAPGDAKIKVLVTSSMDISGVTVLCRPPAGLVLSKGEYEWRGDINRGEVKELFYTLSIQPDTYYKVEFLAKMDADQIKGTTFSIVNINPLKKKVEYNLPQTFKKLPDGNLVIETKGE